MTVQLEHSNSSTANTAHVINASVRGVIQAIDQLERLCTEALLRACRYPPARQHVGLLISR
jgi:hypothetical protein